MEVRDSHCLPNAPLKRVKRESERKQSVRVCVSSWCLSWLTFVEDNTTKHISLCQCKLKQWLEEHTRKHTKMWQVVDRVRAVQERHHHTHRQWWMGGMVCPI